jgi:hypothetical protein
LFLTEVLSRAKYVILHKDTINTESFMQTLSPNAVFPRAYKATQELGIQLSAQGKISEPHHLLDNLQDSLPPDLSVRCDTLINGSRLSIITPDTSKGKKTNPAITTPECSTPDQLHEYLRAAEFIVTRLVEHYVVGQSQSTAAPLQARIQRRVVDGQGSRKGARDSFALPPNSALGNTSIRLPFSVLGHFITRGFIVGAGHNMGVDGLRYAQKTDGVKDVSGSGFKGTMYNRVVDGKVTWLESRNDDVNVSDWATRARIGGTAIILALNHTPLARQLNHNAPSDTVALGIARQMNVLRLNEEGYIVDSPIQRGALDFQRKCLDLFVDKLQLYTDIPPELYAIAREIQKYCDAFEQVLDQKATIASLADWADWASKFVETLVDIDKDIGFGIPRSIYDGRSEAKDLEYDFMLLSSDNGVLAKTRYGYGYVKREALRRKQFRSRAIEISAIERALLKPPKTTRSQIVVDLVRNYPVIELGLAFAVIETPKSRVRIEFPDPLQTELSDHYKQILEKANAQLHNT